MSDSHPQSCSFGACQIRSVADPLICWNLLLHLDLFPVLVLSLDQVRTIYFSYLARRCAVYFHHLTVLLFLVFTFHFSNALDHVCSVRRLPQGYLTGTFNFVPDMPIFCHLNFLIYYSPSCITMYIFNTINTISDPQPTYTVTCWPPITIILSNAYFSCSQNVVPWPPASALSGNSLEMQMLRPHPRPTESKSLGMLPSDPCLVTFPEDSDTQ